MDGLSCRMAISGDLAYIVGLQNDNRESVGHLPTPAIAERIERGTISIGHLNGWPFGYLLYDFRGGHCKIHQACIQYDARRKLYGATLLWWTLDRLDHKQSVTLRCAADLEANLFWKAMGFTPIAVQDGGKRRGRLINVWRRWFVALLIPETGITPVLQKRIDCQYDHTDFVDSIPDGFRDAGNLDKLAWRDYS